MADTVILAEQTVSGFTGESGTGAQVPVSLVSGETYKVLWDGTEYTCIAYTVNMPVDEATLPFVFIGNQAYVEWELGGGMGDMPDAVEPFVINQLPVELTDGAEGVIMFSCAGQMLGTCESDTHTVAIYQVVEEDKEYLIWGSTLKGIANAIRAKNGTSGEIAVSDMATKISEITGGGGSSDVEVVYVTFMSHDGATELYKKPVVPGDDSMCPVAGKLIDTPTKESTVDYTYTFAGWSTEVDGGLNENALKNVTEDRTVYANYIAATRYYTVRFYDGETLLNTMQVVYGGMADYTTEKEGYQFDGWEPSNNNIAADTDCYAQWSEKITFANATWAQIAEISEAGEAANYFAVGDTKQVVCGDDTITVAIAGFDHDDLADGSGKAGISIVCRSVPNLTTIWFSGTYNSSFSYPYTNSHSTSSYTKESVPHCLLASTVYTELPVDLQTVIKPVNKVYLTASNSASTSTVADKLWLLSLEEMGDNHNTWDTSKIPALGSKYELFSSMDYAASSIVNTQAVVTLGSTGTAVGYWTRSQMLQSYWTPRIITAAGRETGVVISSANKTGATAYTTTWYLRFGFCV